MAHHTVKSGYSGLIDRINRFPQGAPASELLYKILGLLFSEKEADLVSLLPIKPFSASKAAKIWKMKESEARKILDQLSSRAILLDIQINGKSIYTLPPPMAGFFEFSLMRIRDDIDQTLLSELFHQYLNVEDDFVRELFTVGETQLGRTFVHEPVLNNGNSLYVLDYEKASFIIKSAKDIGVGLCYCRHKKMHLGTACDAPMEICMTFNSVASSLTRHGYSKTISADECLDLLDVAYENNLVQFGENVQNNVSFICNCCGCCCEALTAARKFAHLNPVNTTNYLPEIDLQNCNGCGKCVNVCPVEAMTLVSANDPNYPKKKIAKLQEEICLGCGVCVRNCSHDGLQLKQRSERVITPVDSVHRIVAMAVERGKLQNLIFDNQTLWNHRAMAAVLGSILKLPKVKQFLANDQVKSHYLERLIKTRSN